MWIYMLQELRELAEEMREVDEVEKAALVVSESEGRKKEGADPRRAEEGRGSVVPALARERGDVLKEKHGEEAADVVDAAAASGRSHGGEATEFVLAMQQMREAMLVMQ
eukprot:PLAT6283.1.p4 GENE.PLAT6283.1~~PLAT6283.1.p4  ORF type:complete len:109 (-),score=27.11 PLAT6283.1:12-338(-)